MLRFSETVTRFAPLVQDGKTYGARLAMVMLPGIFLPPLVIWITERIAPGLLLPVVG